MSVSLEVRAAGVAVFAAMISLGGVLALASPIKWLASSGVTQPPGPSPDVSASPELVAQGRHDFVMTCVECHGDDAHGDEGPDLHNLAISNARIAATIKKGVKGEMPTFAKRYNDAEVSALIAYLRSLR